MEEKNIPENQIENKKLNKKENIKTILYLLVIPLLCFLFTVFIAQRTVVDGTSMEPTLKNNENLIIYKLAYSKKEPERFDIIVFPSKTNPKVNYIKRIIGLPGETVQIDRLGNIYIDGHVLTEDYGKETISSDRLGRAYQPITLREDEYFVLGDNRNNSCDSRFEEVGNVKRKDIKGKIVFRLWPFAKITK